MVRFNELTRKHENDLQFSLLQVKWLTVRAYFYKAQYYPISTGTTNHGIIINVSRKIYIVRHIVPMSLYYT